MPIPKLDDAINDFSAGELDPDVKRSGSPLIKMGGRQMLNWRTLNSHKKSNRPGRSALFLASGRVEEIAMRGGNAFFLDFAAGVLKVFNAVGTQVFSSTVKGDGSTPIPWTANSVGGIVWDQIGLAIYIAYPDGAPNNVPQILTWDGVSQTSTWTLSTYALTVQQSGQKRTAFYRISPQNVTLRPSATTGSVTLLASASVFSAGQIGTRLRYANKQLTITAVASGTQATATVNETLPFAEIIGLTGTVNGSFVPGDIVQGSPSGAQAIVIAGLNQQTVDFASAPGFAVGDLVTGGTSGATGIVTGTPGNNIVVSSINNIAFVGTEVVTNQSGTAHTDTTVSSLAPSNNVVVQVLPTASGNMIYFAGNDAFVGPNGSGVVSGTNTTNNVPPQAIGVWDDEVMNGFRGWPSSLFADQSRLNFCNVPPVPAAIIWSAVGLYTDLFPDVQPNNAFLELVPGNSTVLYVVPGMESSEFVFTDKAIFYVPINVTNPLKPGSASFDKLADYGCMPNVQPRRAEQSIIFMKTGGTQVAAVQVPGAYYRPNIIDNISEMHSHLFTSSSVVAIAIPSGPTQFEENYLYILLANGTAAVGRYTMRQGLLEPGPEGKPTVGWLPWNGAGTIGWMAALQGDVIFTTSYNPVYTDEGVSTNYTAEDGISLYTTASGVSLVEKLDATQYLDGALFVNNLPPAFTPGGIYTAEDGVTPYTAEDGVSDYIVSAGSFFFFPGPGTTVTLIDQGTRFMGTYNIDAGGNLIPQNIGGENLASPQLVAGQPWTAVFEPFMPHAPGGADQQQRMRRRKVAKGLVSVEKSTGFVFGTRRVPYYFVGDDATQPAPLREDSYQIRPRGRTFDPRIVLTKDTPGPLIVVEYGFEVTV